ncbi:alpha/beta fold hydrolase [Glaciecola siphonariae]|uniref:Alpha/beta fold hydrolase n=1 Tax=Glaciecola siphonariae TaxID=521012 RepID=A0ABV9LVV7_9ALTE
MRDETMLSESFDAYLNNARWFQYGSHKIAYWDSGAPVAHHFSAPDSSPSNADLSLIHSQSIDKQPPILFLHGFPSASWDWHHQWAHFIKSHRCIAFDMLGFGISDKPTKYKYSVLEQAKIAIYLCQKLKISRLHIVAHDYGVSVAQQLLSLQNSESASVDIESLCFLNGGLFAELHRPLLTQKLLHSVLGPLLVKCMNKGSLRRSFGKIFGPETPPSQADIDTIWRLLEFKNGMAVLPKLLDYLDERVLHRDRWVASMQSTSTPLGFINGVFDPISGEHMLAQFNALLPDAASIGINVGHYPQLEAPRRVSDLIANFINSKGFA